MVDSQILVGTKVWFDKGGHQQQGLSLDSKEKDNGEARCYLSTS
jgi:hypothetical protein